jgi:hypothetical protein
MEIFEKIIGLDPSTEESHTEAQYKFSEINNKIHKGLTAAKND